MFEWIFSSFDDISINVELKVIVLFLIFILLASTIYDYKMNKHKIDK